MEPVPQNFVERLWNTFHKIFQNVRGFLLFCSVEPSWNSVPYPVPQTGLSFLPLREDVMRTSRLWICPHVKYGCAVILRAIVPHGVWNVIVLGLDCWEYGTAHIGSTRVPFATCPPQPAILPCGDLPAGHEGSFCDQFTKLLEISTSRTAEGRHSVSGKGRGHQKTPAFIAAVAIDAIRAAVTGLDILETKETEVQGGTTDVGQHTGSEPRMTAWPLACSLLLHLSVNEFAPINSAMDSLDEDILVAESDIRNVAIACFACRAAEVTSLSVSHASIANAVNSIMVALQTATRHIAKAPTADLGMKKLCRRVKAVRQRADELGRALDRTGNQPELPVQGPDAREVRQMFSPRIALHDDLLPKPTPGQRRGQSARVSETWPLITNDDGSIGDFNSWWQSLDGRKNASTDLLRLRAADNYIAKMSKRLHYLSVEDGELSDSELDALQKLVDDYVLTSTDMEKAWREKRRRSDTTSGSPTVESLRSSRILLLWISWCLFHAALAADHEEVLLFGTPLSLSWLRYLVLPLQPSQGALLNVVRYISSLGDGGALFDGTCGSDSATAKFVDLFVGDYDWYENRLEQLFNEARQAREDWYERVCNLQKYAGKLEQVDIPNAKEAKAEAELARRDCQCERTRYRYECEHEKRFTRCSNELTRLRSELSKIRAPRREIEKLPRERKIALRVLALTDLPRRVKLVARMTFRCQLSLHDFIGDPTSMPFSWTKSLPCNEDADVEIMDAEMTQAPFIDYRTVVSPDQGGWPPVFGKGARMIFEEYGDAFSDESLEQRMHDLLAPTMERELSFLVASPKTNADQRDNRAPAQPGCRPDGLKSDSDYFAVAALRARPLIQHARIASFLASSMSETFRVEEVQIVVRQTLFQVGDIDEKISFAWRHDAERCSSDLITALRERVLELLPKKRDYEALPVLADVANFLASAENLLSTNAQQQSARNLARQLATAAKEWAEDGLKEIDTAEFVRHKLIRAKAGLHWGLVVLCHDVRSQQSLLTAKDVQQVLLAHVMLQRVCSIVEKDWSGYDLLQSLHFRALDVVATHLKQIVTKENVTKALLNKVLGAVIGPANVPPELNWKVQKNENGPLSCEFVAGEFSIDVLEGLVLVSGLPPGRLPGKIREDATFVRTFGERDFEVIPVPGSRSVRTTTAIDTRFWYEFFLDQDRVVVTEIDVGPGKHVDDGTRLELLPHGDEKLVNYEIPLRLHKLHSHWLFRGSNQNYHPPVILFRDVHFRERSVSHVQHGVGEAATLAQVPRARRKRWSADGASSWLDNSKSFRQYVCHDPADSALRALERIESLCFVHVLRDLTTMQLHYELPRLRLNFTWESQNAKEGFVISQEYRGYRLRRQPHFAGLLRGFATYLALERLPAEQPDRDGMSTTKIIIPDDVADNVVPDLERVHDAANFHHRFHKLVASSVSGRLRLASLYAKFGTRLPEELDGCTGAQTALRLLRECWISRPFTIDEEKHLSHLREFTGLDPALELVAGALQSQSKRTSFLHGTTETEPGTKAPEWIAAQAEYQCPAHAWQRSLTLKEELELFGSSFRNDSSPTLSSFLRRYSPADVPARHSETQDRQDVPTESYTKNVEECLFNVAFGNTPLSEGDDNGSIVREFPFPLQSEAGSSSLHRDFIESLHQSHLRWAEVAKSRLRPKEDWVLLSQFCQDRVAEVDQKRSAIEVIFFQEFCGNRLTPFGDELSSPIECLTVLADRSALGIRRATTADLLELIWTEEPSAVLQRLEFGTIDAFPGRIASREQRWARERCSRLQSLARDWGLLCVLEDKLQRLIGFCRRPEVAAAHIQTDCRNMHAFSVSKYPRWCAFEVEGGLQVREEQVAVARHLIKAHRGKDVKQGCATQLNMGLGKTRVILPMLALHFASERKIPRLHFLAELLGEGRDSLAKTLTASTFQMRLYEMPFHRNLILSEREFGIMNSALSECLNFGGALIMAPDHRVSLMLKGFELEEGRSLASHRKLMENLGCDRVVDIFDEIDEAQHHRWHLVYAVGLPKPLEEGSTRWLCAELLLDILFQPVPDSKLDAKLSLPDLVDRTKTQRMNQTETCTGVRFLKGHLLAEEQTRLARLLAGEVFDSATRGERGAAFVWLANFVRSIEASKQYLFRELFVQCVSDPAEEVSGVLSQFMLSDNQLQTVFALRGLLAHGVLFQCLQLRPFVDFGLRPQSALSTTRLAVPYRSCDSPAPRAEFSHPDVGIVLSSLTYYRLGLNANQLRSAVTELLRCGLNEQRKEYDLWLQESSEFAPVPDEISTVEMLDLSNERQFDTLLCHFSHNRSTVNFFLNKLVFPKDTRQYPKELISSSWDLATESTIGFTGTNELSRLLPVSIRSDNANVDVLEATDGMMLDYLLRQSLDTAGVYRVPADATAWQAVLEHCIVVKAGALIDVSGLLAGTSNRRAANYVVTQLEKKACTYFDQTDGFWRVCTAEETWPLEQSPIEACDSFAIFDQMHCRGSDLRLEPNCVGLITLGPGLRKDQLAQGAGRLRQLHAGQRMRFAALVDVYSDLEALANGSPISALQILQWALTNSVAANEAGLIRWTSNGLDWVNEKRQKDLDFSLRTMYSPCTVRKLVMDVIHSRGQKLGVLPKMCQELFSRVDRYGSDHSIVVGAQFSVDHECERETEIEQESEAEKEMVLPSVAPAWAEEWDFAAARKPKLERADWPNLSDLRSAFQALGMQPDTSARAIWMKVKAFTSSNFRNVVMESAGDQAAEYIRRVDNVLVYPHEGTVVLLSEYDSNELVRLSEATDDASRPELGMPLVRSLPLMSLDAARWRKEYNINVETWCALQLYSGEVNFSAEERDVVLSLLDSARDLQKARAKALRLVDLRGASGLFYRSELDQWTKDFA